MYRVEPRQVDISWAEFEQAQDSLNPNTLPSHYFHYGSPDRRHTKMASDTLLPLRQGKENLRTSDNGINGSSHSEDIFQNRPRRKAIGRLEPALHILERFHHRNKNQHRINKWWAEADMLRRQVRKILEGLHAGLGDEERGVTRMEMLARKGSSCSSVAKKKGKEKENEDEHGFKKDEFGIYERAVYIRGLLVPRAWFAFTQLVADRQFSQLGLMLLAVLAQVDQALSSFAPGPEFDGEEGEAGLQDERETLSAAAGAVEEETEEDVGVAISRYDFLLSTIPLSVAEARSTAERLERLERRVWRKKMKGYDLDTDGGMDIDTDDNDIPSSPTMAVSTESGKRVIDVTAIKAEETVAGDEEDSAIDTRKKKKRPRSEKEQDSNREDGEWGGMSDGDDQNDDIGSIFASLIPMKKKRVKETSASMKTITKSKSRPEEPEVDEAEDDIGSIFDSMIPKKETKKASSTATATAPVKAKSKEGSKERGTEKKKKKKKQGDEFDDIFGGLL